MITTLRICLSAAAIVAGASFAVADEQPATPTTPASTAAPASSDAAEPPADPSDPNTVICKRQAITGTRVGKYHLCMTRKEWDEMAHRSSEDTGRLQRDGDFGKQRRGPR